MSCTRLQWQGHDGIGQSLAALGLQIEGLKVNHYKKKELESGFNLALKLLSETVTELRRVCFNTLPYVLQEFGLVLAVRELETKIFGGAHCSTQKV